MAKKTIKADPKLVAKYEKEFAEAAKDSKIEPLEKPDLTKIFEEELKAKEEAQLPKAIQESLARPTDPVTLANETIAKEYPWCLPSLTSPQRALLCELIRIRKLLEDK